MVLPIVIFLNWVWHRLLLLLGEMPSFSDLLKNNPGTASSKQALSAPPSPPSFPSLAKCSLHGREDATLVCDVHGGILRTRSFFPYFMLVAFEGGGILRAFVLLLSCSFLWALDYENKLRVMIFVTFCGLRLKDMEGVSRAVLPKFYLENVDAGVFDVVESVGRRVVFTSVPRVMVEGFLREYLRVGDIVGTELAVHGEYFTGLLSGYGLMVKHRAVKEFFGDSRPDIGLGGSTFHDHLFMSLCKEAYTVDRESSSELPRSRYPKPLIFHDGRLAFLPTPLATLAMFMWLPVGIPIMVFRLAIGILLPHRLALFFGGWSGIKITLKGDRPKRSTPEKGVLYVCTHRTLLDPVLLATTLGQDLTAVTYSLSRVSEFIAPLRTVRLTRDRSKDSETMQRLLREGDLVVCPEGTTCREPYLLRFSSLFAELADEIVPVAVDVGVTMFYGTTASGLKCLDPIFFLMNPRPRYCVHVLGKVPRELTCAGGRSSHEVANYIQKLLGDALGFECTNLTRKDKYMMLAGNEGIVVDRRSKT